MDWVENGWGKPKIKPLGQLLRKSIEEVPEDIQYAESSKKTLTAEGFTGISVPGIPRSPSTTPGVERIVVNWYAPDFNGNSIITLYHVYAQSDDKTETILKKSNIRSINGQFRATITGLKKNSYKFYIFARNRAGSSQPLVTDLISPLPPSRSASFPSGYIPPAPASVDVSAPVPPVSASAPPASELIMIERNIHNPPHTHHGNHDWEASKPRILIRGTDSGVPASAPAQGSSLAIPVVLVNYVESPRKKVSPTVTLSVADVVGATNYYYFISNSIESTPTWNQITSTSVPKSIIISDLEPYIPYYVWAKVTNGASSSVSLPKLIGPSSSPQDIAINASSRNLTITWKTPLITSSPIKRYMVIFHRTTNLHNNYMNNLEAIDSDFSAIVTPTPDSSGVMSHTFTNVPQGTYYAYIIADNDSGASKLYMSASTATITTSSATASTPPATASTPPASAPPSTASTPPSTASTPPSTASTPPSTRPKAPQKPEFTISYEGSSAVIDVRRPKDVSNNEIPFSQLSYRYSVGSYPFAGTKNDDGSGRLIMPGNIGDTYYIQIYAINEFDNIKTFGETAERSFTIPNNSPPGVPEYTITPTSTGIIVTITGGTYGSTRITSYRYVFSDNDTEPVATNYNNTPIPYSDTIPFTFPLTYTINTRSYIWIKAYNQNGSGPSKKQEIIIPKPEPVTLTLVPGSGSVTATWTPSQYATHYEYLIFPAPTSGPYTEIITETTKTVNNLLNGSTYTFKVRAKNVAGVFSEAVEKSVTLDCDIPITPEPPTAVINDGAPTTVTVSWVAPTEPAGCSITAYTVVTYSGGNQERSTPVGKVLTTQISGLTPGSLYTFKVSSTIGTGSSLKSSALSASSVALTIPRNCLQSPWSECSKTCGGGEQTRSTIETQAGSGVACGPLKQPCNTQVCSVDCQGSWSSCTTNCGPGTQTYTITTQQSGTGAQCPATHGQTRDCGNAPCIPNTNCVGSWSSCTTSCGPGTQTYNVTTPQSGTGSQCPAIQGQTRDCGNAACIANTNCVGSWSQCTTSCGPGTQTYNVTTPQSGTGSQCPAIQGQSRDCGNAACSLTPPELTLTSYTPANYVNENPASAAFTISDVPGANKYYYSHSINSSNTPSWIETTKSFTIPTLTRFVPHYVLAKATNTTSAVSSTSVPILVGPPGPSRNISISATSTNITVTWKVPSASDPPVQVYSVGFGTSTNPASIGDRWLGVIDPSGPSSRTFSPDANGVMSYTTPATYNVVAGTYYGFVLANNANGNSLWYPSANTATITPSAPKTTIDIIYRTSSEIQGLINYTATSGSPTVRGYQYYYSTNGTLPDNPVWNDNPFSGMYSIFTISGLSPNTQYYVWSRRTNGQVAVSGTQSDRVEFTTLIAVPGTPTITNMTIDSTNAVDHNIISVYFTNTSGGTPTNYKYTLNGTTYTSFNPPQVSSPLKIPITNVQSINLPLIRIVATNNGGDSAQSPSIQELSFLSTNITVAGQGETPVLYRTSIGGNIGLVPESYYVIYILSPWYFTELPTYTEEFPGYNPDPKYFSPTTVRYVFFKEIRIPGLLTIVVRAKYNTKRKYFAIKFNSLGNMIAISNVYDLNYTGYLYPNDRK
jgi:hypothetical protein